MVGAQLLLDGGRTRNAGSPSGISPSGGCAELHDVIVASRAYFSARRDPFLELSTTDTFTSPMSSWLPGSTHLRSATPPRPHVALSASVDRVGPAGAEPTTYFPAYVT
jgi:hypothetical protein